MILQIISYQIKDYMRDHGSIGLFWEWCFGEKFGSKCFGLFLFYFCLVWGEKVASAQDFGWQSKGEIFFPCYIWLVGNNCVICFCNLCIWSGFSNSLKEGADKSLLLCWILVICGWVWCHETAIWAPYWWLLLNKHFKKLSELDRKSVV